MTKVGVQAGWKATGYRWYRGRRISEDLGIFETWVDADQAADLFHRSHRQTESVTIERNYKTEEEET